MVRDNRIKEVRFSRTFSAATTGSFAPNQDPASINGEILEVSWAFNRTGSLALSIGAEAQEFFRRNAPSGTGWQNTAPARFQQSTTGSIAGARHAPFVVNQPVWLQATGVASGTQALSMVVRYR